MRRGLRIRRPSASAVAATIVLLFVFGVFLLVALPVGSRDQYGGGQQDVIVSVERLRAVQPGTNRTEVERFLGSKGPDALSYVDTGIAVEPMDASCIYYRARQDSFNDVAQLCFRDDKLISRRMFIAPRS